MAPLIAITNVPSPRLTECELTWLERAPISYGDALHQHDAYCDLLRDCGAEVLRLDVNKEYPDSVFVEDTAVVLDEIAVAASMGAASRRGEVDAIADALSEFREVVRMQLPARLDGGDVVVVGRRILVGASARTDTAGAASLRDIVSRFGYSVAVVPVHDCLHLKSGCTALPDGRLLVNPSWVKPGDLPGFETLSIDADEAFAADVACVGETVVAAASFPRTTALLLGAGYMVKETDLSEFAKAEGGVTCLSLIFGR